MFTIRESIPEDFKAIAEISGKDLGYECSEATVLTELERYASSEHDGMVLFSAVDTENGEVAGFIQAEDYKPVYFEKLLVNLLGLAVKSDFQGMGVGTKLLCAVEEWAEKRGACGVRVNSGAVRTAAHEFYRSRGYASEKTQLRFIKPLNGAKL